MNKEIQGPIVECVVVSKEERIQDQARVLELQRELILKEDQDVKAAQNTVETEMKIYSSVLQQSYSSALSTKKIEAALRKLNDKEELEQ